LSPQIALNDARFAHETIDGETMIMDTVRGHLIMVSGGGSFILQLIGSRTPWADIVSDIGARYGEEAKENARTFLDEFTASGVLVEVEQSSGRAVSNLNTSAPRPPEWPVSWAPTVIERYEDIAEIIAMDPIHDVNTDGWPRKIS
jgi:hypothetical protein